MQLLPFEPRDAMHQISLSKYCINKGNARLDRATLCNAMAARLAKDDPSPFGLAVAASIATRFNWEAPKQLAIEANKKAATDHMLNKAVGSNAPIMECMSNPTHGSALNRSAGLAPQNLSTP